MKVKSNQNSRINSDKFWSRFNISWVKFEKIQDRILGLNDKLRKINVYPNPS